MGRLGGIDPDRGIGTDIEGGERGQGLGIVNIGTDHGIGIGKGIMKNTGIETDHEAAEEKGNGKENIGNAVKTVQHALVQGRKLRHRENLPKQVHHHLNLDLITMIGIGTGIGRGNGKEKEPTGKGPTEKEWKGKEIENERIGRDRIGKENAKGNVKERGKAGGTPKGRGNGNENEKLHPIAIAKEVNGVLEETKKKRLKIISYY